jgi:hydroxyacylglutathione hydrolase
LEIKPFFFGGIIGNCYLVETETGFILIDTARESKRSKLERELESAGCIPDNLKLIILTHGDFDHTGNCAYLREKFGAKIAMHHYDSGMVEHGDMFWNRKTGNILIRIIINFLFRISKFKPDLTIDEGYDFLEYGLDARVLYLPGHSKGSIGILTADGDLFCGDLLENKNKPNIGSIIDDKAAANASIEKLKKLEINTVYPGHGKPFQMSSFI